jgi:hypothetical protein
VLNLHNEKAQHLTKDPFIIKEKDPLRSVRNKKYLSAILEIMREKRNCTLFFLRYPNELAIVLEQCSLSLSLSLSLSSPSVGLVKRIRKQLV